MSCVSALYHIVISTRYRRNTIPEAACEKLYRFIWSRVKASGSRLLRINGVSNHVHLLIDLNASRSLSSVMADIKSTSSKWMKASPDFPLWESWGKEYYAFSVSFRNREQVISYIKNQKQHHSIQDLTSELDQTVVSEGFEWTDLID